MRVTDSIFSRTINVKTEDPYMLSLDIMKRVSNFAKVIEKRNNYMTDGPRHMSEVIFDAIQYLDEHTRIKMSFNLVGEDGSLGICVEAVVIVNIIRYGLVSDMFSEYYMRNIYPNMRKEIETKADSLIKQTEKVLRFL